MNFSCSLYSLTISVQDGNVTVHQNRLLSYRRKCHFGIIHINSPGHYRTLDIRNRLYMTGTYSDSQTVVTVFTLHLDHS